MTTRVPAGRQRVLRTLTFWLRPAFVLRTLTRFQRVAGFDRAIALASSALTALISLVIVISAILPNIDAEAAANAIINRYGLTGECAHIEGTLGVPSGMCSRQRAAPAPM